MEYGQTALPSHTGCVGQEIYALASEIFPLCRSITGQGVRDTLDILACYIPLERRSVRTDERLFDWTVPKEWVIRDAFIKDEAGRRIVDFHACNLHVVSYSTPIHRRMPLEELRRHIHTLPDQPHLIPYRTSYYAESWGFCMAHEQLEALSPGIYEVRIDSELKDGRLDYGELVVPGTSGREFLLSAHVCHPSLANDNCSGLALLAILARQLRGMDTRYTYRFIFAPGTIGALAWLAQNEQRLHLIDMGLVISCVGDAGGPTYKRSRRGNTFIDRAVEHVLKHCGRKAEIRDFSPYGYDERQYCSPGFNLPVGLFQHSPFGEFPEYHTSADNLDFIAPEHLERAYRTLAEVIRVAEGNWTPLNLSPKGEPQLGRRGLYGSTGGDKAAADGAMAMLWVLNLADGTHTLLDIAERAGLPFARIAEAAGRLKEKGLLAEAAPPTSSSWQEAI